MVAFGWNEIDEDKLADFYEAFGLGMSALLHTLRLHLPFWIHCRKLETPLFLEIEAMYQICS